MSGPGQPAAINIGSTISQTFAVIGRNLGPLLLLAVVCVGIPNVLSDLSLIGIPAGDGTAFDVGVARFGAGQFAAQFLSLVSQSLLVAGTMHIVAADMREQRATASDGFRTLLACLGPVLGLALLTSLGIGLGTLLFIVPGIILMLRWFIAIPVRIMEGPGVGRAMGRSAEMMRGNYWRCFALVLVYIVALLVASVLVALVDPSAADQATTVSGIAVETALVIAVSIVAAVGVSVVYVQLRRLNAGGDSENVAAVFG